MKVILVADVGRRVAHRFGHRQVGRRGGDEADVEGVVGVVAGAGRGLGVVGERDRAMNAAGRSRREPLSSLSTLCRGRGCRLGRGDAKAAGRRAPRPPLKLLSLTWRM